MKKEENTEEQELIADLRKEEEELIKKKSPLKQKLINEFQDVFSQNLTRDQALKNAEMKITIDKTKEKARTAYNYRPRNIPENIRKKAKQMSNQEDVGSDRLLCTVCFYPQKGRRLSG